jgi:uncharacterized protein YegL
MKAAENATGRQKATVVEDQVSNREHGLIQRLQRSTRAHEISLAIVTFDHQVKPLINPTPVLQLDPASVQLDLMARHGGETAIGDALQTAATMADQFLAQEEEGIPRYVTILLMSDGQNNRGANPLTVANDIKGRTQDKEGRSAIVIAAAAYGDDADVNTLRQIATHIPDQPDKFFAKVQTGEQLRQFFLSSMVSAG